MKLSEYEKVDSFIDMLKRITAAIDQCKIFTDAQESTESKTRYIEDGLNQRGYWATISTHADGSGPRVELDGCYVGAELGRATLLILEAKKVNLLDWLSNHGVNVDE